MLKLVVFDCDGVMFSSLEANRVYYNHLLEAFDCPPMDENELHHVHSHNVEDSTRHIFRHHSQISLTAVSRYRETLDYTPFLQRMIIEPDLIPFLHTIRPKYHTAISTNRSTTMGQLLDSYKLREFFDMVVTPIEAGKPKPDPQGMEMILDRFQTKREEVIYIGDSQVDRELCQQVGIDLIAFKNKNLEARYSVNTFMEILALQPFSGLASD